MIETVTITLTKLKPVNIEECETVPNCNNCIHSNPHSDRFHMCETKYKWIQSQKLIQKVIKFVH
jgi:hypothetical protein